MKFRRRPVPFIVLLLPVLCPVLGQEVRSESKALLARDANPANVVVDQSVVPNAKANPVGTKDAPVDGKDGKPHAGPFIETEAERSRKKAKESGDEEKPLKPIPATTKDQYAADGELPQSNEGVMDDPNRVGPKEGTRGTEGGVTEKSRDSRIGEEKKPDPPKEQPPLPHSEEQHVKGATTSQDKDVSKSSSKKDEEEKKLLDKPQDLPDKPHDIPIPENPSSPKNMIDYGEEKPDFKTATASSHNPDAEEPSAVIQPLHSLLLSFTMILISEIGDKTFLVAALMAMRHPRGLVFTAAYSALITMTVLSAVLGHAVPTLIPKSITNFAAAALFLVFGIKMGLEGRKMSPDEGVSEEMKEVEMELEEKEHQNRRSGRRKSPVTPYVLEAGRGVRKSRPSTSRLPSPPESPSSTSSRESSPTRASPIKGAMDGVGNLFSLLLSPAWVQTFVMTFLGEWGDRSQIATIAMAAGQDYWWVTAGALGGHAICTAAAVVGGRAIAGRVSLRVVTLGGAVAFLVFGFIYLFEAIY